MNDIGKIFAGLIIFLIIIIAVAPTAYNYTVGKADYKPNPKIDTQEKQCVKSSDWMTSSHMTLLDAWRDLVVRGGDRIFVAEGGKEYEMSLSKTCMKCHPKKSEFCDKCHDYTAVKPYCWDCHVEPKENN